ncbi:hypothetical protein LRS10_13590 [Phenylobacterium sp. J426]|uniref:hypothetical protein n=1 Tax=Phenylobacterium sp. J426 TaxID=2898439 RepID=UPI002150D1DC|nr:hypothetical protein [Phenylobacterium sp. J426]MCR5875126.1 hypothetical protein [Phenylobacterium sp. J426]
MPRQPYPPHVAKMISDGCVPTPVTPADLDHLCDARREASCIGLDVADAQRARDARKRRQHIADALGRAHQLIHMLKAADAEAQERAA